MSITCMLITTNVTNRLHLLENTVRSIEQCNSDLFDAKVMSVDILPNGSTVDYFNRFERRGWTVVSGACAGRNGIVNNQRRGLSHVSTDWVFYTEDDIRINRIPPKLCLSEIDQYRLPSGKKIGFICFNTHIDSATDNGSQERKKFVNDPANYITIGHEQFLVKNYIVRDEYYLNFPVSIVRKPLFDKMHNYAASNCGSQGVEPGLTHAWFGMQLDHEYESLVYVKPDTTDRLPRSLEQFHDQSNMSFWNNDPSFRHPSINNRENSLF